SMRDLEKKFQVILSLLNAKEKKPLDVHALKDLGILTHDQANSLEAGASKWVQSTLTNPNEARSPFIVWLGRDLVPVAARQLPEDFG
ncbi:hypothetical protein J0J30_23855, partial [Vibrio vulnificus]|nr:hypothetical protein [Vibrio vulnificus]